MTSMRRSVAVFCMPETGHFQRMRSLIAGLAGRGLAVHVFTDGRFRAAVESAAGTFIDLFAKYPLERADAASLPIGCRFVSFAGHYAEAVRRDVEALGPSLVIHDTFAVIGRVVADLLRIPRVNVCAGHNVVPARFLADLPGDPRVKVSPACLQAVEALRDSYGLADASPFSYVSSLSPHLNLYCEPPEFLDEEERRPFEPIAFWGSLPGPEERPGADGAASAGRRASGSRPLEVYVSFGTVIWRYYATEALRALAVLAEVFSRIDDLRAVVSLGGTDIGADAGGALARPNVTVESYVDQWEVLQRADAFVTHHGMNSTHEAIFHRVPMISYPFFWDQPGLAAKCRRFGLAVPLADAPRAVFDEGAVEAALTRLAEEREAMEAALEQARGWELAVIEGRAAVLQRIMDLAC